jgi:hypothetical protein
VWEKSGEEPAGAKALAGSIGVWAVTVGEIRARPRMVRARHHGRRRDVRTGSRGTGRPQPGGCAACCAWVGLLVAKPHPPADSQGNCSLVRAIHNRTLVCRGLEAESFLMGVHEMSMMDDDTQGGQVP